MTSEVLILNKRAVVIGADSAVTTSGGADHPRYAKTANKIFELTKHGSVAAAIYGSASINQVPWEVVLKQFRRHLGDEKFDGVAGYATALTKYLSGNNVLFPVELREKWVAEQFDRALVHITKHVSGDAPAITDVNVPLDERKAAWQRQAMELDATLDRSGLDGTLKREPFDVLVSNLQPWTDRAQAQLDASPILAAIDATQISALAHKLRYTFPKMVLPTSSGVAVTGYGEEQIFPAFTRLNVFGHVGDELFHTLEGDFAVTHTSFAMIQPLAQSSMIDMFTDGFGRSSEIIIDNKSRDMIKDVFAKLRLDGVEISSDVEQKISATCHDSFSIEWKKANWHDNLKPLIDVLQNLSVGEMAHLAESLLGLQSLKERVTSASETVGGPIDVAAISKDEGLVWIKRKHYFDQELNPRYAARLNRSFN